MLESVAVFQRESEVIRMKMKLDMPDSPEDWAGPRTVTGKVIRRELNHPKRKGNLLYGDRRYLMLRTLLNHEYMTTNELDGNMWDQGNINDALRILGALGYVKRYLEVGKHQPQYWKITPKGRKAVKDWEPIAEDREKRAVGVFWVSSSDCACGRRDCPSNKEA